MPSTRTSRGLKAIADEPPPEVAAAGQDRCIIPIKPQHLDAWLRPPASSLTAPMSSVTDIPSVPGELFVKFQTGFYSDPVDAVFKALRVE